MAIPDVDEKREVLQKNLDELLEFTPEKLARDDLGESLSFAEAREVIEGTLQLFRQLNNANLIEVPYQTLQKFDEYTQDAIQKLTQIEEFSLEKHSQNPLQARNKIVTQLYQSYAEYFDYISPRLAFLERGEADVETLTKQAQASAEEMEKLRAKHASELQAFRADAEQILESLRGAAAEGGVSQHAGHFKQEADDHKKQGKFWLKVTTRLAAVTALLAAGVAGWYLWGDVPLTTEQMVQVGIAKLVFFSVLYFGIVWSARNFRSQQHNFVVNKHRQNALGTFQAFAKAASDETTKNAVLLRATEAIFNPGISGYVSGEGDKSGSPQIFEILRSGLTRTEE